MIYAQRQMLYPMGTETVTDSIRDVLVHDGHSGETLNQMTQAVLRQKLGESAAIASYHDLFALFAILALVCLVPVLLLRSSRRHPIGGSATTHPTQPPAQSSERT